MTELRSGHPLPYCQCPSGNAPCGYDITEEDMLCDGCRRGDCRPRSECNELAYTALREDYAQQLLKSVPQLQIPPDTIKFTTEIGLA